VIDRVESQSNKIANVLYKIIIPRIMNVCKLKDLFLLFFIILTVVSCKNNPNPDPRYKFDSSSLIAYYPFDGNAQDLSDSAYNGTVHNAVLTTGRNDVKGGAYLFDGFSSYIELPSSMALNSDSCFSIEAWINNDSITSDGKYTDNAIYGQSDGLYGSDYPVVLFEVKKDNTIRGGIRGTSNPTLDVRSTISIKNNAWHHLVYVRDSKENSLKLYIDGNLAANDTLALVGNTKSNDSVSIGGYFDDLQQVYHFFCGKIDMVRIWREALSQEEIKALKEDNYIIE
jgi:hypothetical protein